MRHSAITALNGCEDYVLHKTMFLEKLPFCLEIAVPVACFFFRKHAYIFMKSAAESRNVILHSTVRSDSLFKFPLWQHWIIVLYVHPFQMTGISMTCRPYGCNLSAIKLIDRLID